MQLRVVQRVKDDRVYNQKIFESFEEAVEYGWFDVDLYCLIDRHWNFLLQKFE